MARHARRSADDWWMSPAPGSGRRLHHSRIGQRDHERGSRLPGIRALVIYPLNALAEDQMSRLRQALDSDGIRAWLAANRPGTASGSADIPAGRRSPVVRSGDNAEAELERICADKLARPAGRRHRCTALLSSLGRRRDVEPVGHAGCSAPTS